MVIYKLFRDEFSSWFLEIIKPSYQKPIDKETYLKTLGFFGKMLQLLHPFMPFITEEIWQYLEERKAGESIMITRMPSPGRTSLTLLSEFEQAKEIIIAVRGIRSEKNIPQKEMLELLYSTNGDYHSHFNPVIMKMANLTDIREVKGKPDEAVSFINKNKEFYIPVGMKMNKEEELKRLESELAYAQGFLILVNKKLENERFVKGAPEEVVKKEYEKKSDAENKIKVLQHQIAQLR